MPMIDFYHYTSRDGKNAILRTRVIKASKRRTRDAFYGEGVYGTTLDPVNFSKMQVAANNYDSRHSTWMNFLDTGKVDYAFRIKVPSQHVVRINHPSRQILLYKGDMWLDNYYFEYIEVPEAVPQYEGNVARNYTVFTR